MRSGDEHDGWEGEYYQRQLRQISDYNFVQKVFAPGPALVELHPSGKWRESRPFEGEKYDESKYKVVENQWDHEHCYVCDWRIDDDYSYWQNASRIILCDVCHEYIQEKPQADMMK